MFDPIKQVQIENVTKLANRLVNFATGSTCTRITRTGSVNVEDVVKDQEEADLDTKIALVLTKTTMTET